MTFWSGHIPFEKFVKLLTKQKSLKSHWLIVYYLLFFAYGQLSMLCSLSISNHKQCYCLWLLIAGAKWNEMKYYSATCKCCRYLIILEYYGEWRFFVIQKVYYYHQDIGRLYVDEVVEYCQLETFSARCRQGDVVVMTTARFGRMRFGRCIDASAYSDSIIKQDDRTIGCYADVQDYADRTCSGKTACDIAVPNRDLLSTRPCVSQLTMYFEAAYICVSGEFCGWFMSAGVFSVISNLNKGSAAIKC